MSLRIVCEGEFGNVRSRRWTRKAGGCADELGGITRGGGLGKIDLRPELEKLAYIASWNWWCLAGSQMRWEGRCDERSLRTV